MLKYSATGMCKVSLWIHTSVQKENSVRVETSRFKFIILHADVLKINVGVQMNSSVYK